MKLHTNAFLNYIYRNLIRFRNPSLSIAYNEIARTSHLSDEEIMVLQRRKLVKLVTFARSNSIYYKNVLPEITEQQCISDILQSLPILSKEDALANVSIIRTDRQHKFSKVFKAGTSGTSGQALMFPRNEEWDSFNRASICYGLNQYNVGMLDFNIFFWGYNKGLWPSLKIRLVDKFLNRLRVFDKVDYVYQTSKKKLQRAVYIDGYSSQVYLLCMEAKSLNLPRLKIVKATSEKIYPHFKENIKKNIGIPMVSEYGSAEAGIIAFECPHGTLHVNHSSVIVEINENDEILVTNLNSYSFPFIRYNLGDYVNIERSMCKCGRKGMAITEIVGRIGQKVFGENNEYPSFTTYYITKNIYKKHSINTQIQYIQKEPGELMVLLPSSLRHLVDDINSEAAKYFGDDIRLVFKFDELQYSSKGKFSEFISQIGKEAKI